MKRIISGFLALVMCLALSACGVSGEYAGLVDALDAGDYTQVKTELSGLSDDFKAEQEQMAEDEGLVEKYADVLALLEAGDYEAAGEAVLGRMPEPVYTAVEINDENWEEYFTLEYSEEWLINGFGECDTFSNGYTLSVAPEYADRFVESEEAYLNYRYSSTGSMMMVYPDFAEQTYDIHMDFGASTDEYDSAIVPAVSNDLLVFWMSVTDLDDEGLAMLLLNDSYEILSMEGVIYLTEE